uniref:hypothetical protein n=1 Tax=Nonomuraea bangladeshensis TaxID=404385 RepID=UPI003F490C3D
MVALIGGSGTPEPKPVLPVWQILLTAADSISTAPQDGKYWVRGGVNGREQRGPTSAYTIRSDRLIEIWLPRAFEGRLPLPTSDHINSQDHPLS